ncbi:MAG: HAD-IIIA family hydrolase, partial [Pseudomonadota bacterium]
MVTEPRDVQLVMLDRDGVINHDSSDYIKHADEWHPIDGSIDAIAKLSEAGFVVCIATNQAGIGRGLFTQEDLDGIHERLTKEVTAAGGTITHIEFCPHHPDEH